MSKHKTSAGILMYRFNDGKVEVFIGHQGGPTQSGKDIFGTWTVPKGGVEKGEDLFETAKREFREETGFDVSGEFTALPPVTQPRDGKVIHIWAIEADYDPSKAKSNTYKIEWPRGSGEIHEYPEVDRYDWIEVEHAKNVLGKGQILILTELQNMLKNK
jgi:predicted NUDIX family NTP pyrophosphohydrolase